MMKKILICLIITSIIPLFCACSKKEEEVLRPVEYVLAQSSKSIKNKAFSGYLKSATLTNLSFQIEGYLERIYPSEGAKVKSGQLLAKLAILFSVLNIPITTPGPFSKSKTGILFSPLIVSSALSPFFALYSLQL